MLVVGSSTHVLVSIGIEDDLKLKAEHQSNRFLEFGARGDGGIV